MLPALLADVVMVAHLAFVVFVGIGGLLVLWRRWVAWVHLPCAVYGASIEFWGWTCPLTPLELSLRRTAGQAGFEGGFIEHHLQPLLYPSNWGAVHVWLGVAVVVGNALVYALVLWRWRVASRGDAGTRTPKVSAR